MGTAVRERPKIRSNDSDPVWSTTPVHGNSRRLCEIKKYGEPCGHRAEWQTCVADVAIPIEDVVYHCDDSRHIANAHKQITQAVNNFYS